MKFKWFSKCEQSFRSIKKKLLPTGFLLTLILIYLLLVLATDDSFHGTSEALSHVVPDNPEKPIGFLYRTLTAAKKRHSQVDNEAPALIFGVKNSFKYLYGNRFTLFSDSKSSVFIFSYS